MPVDVSKDYYALLQLPEVPVPTLKQVKSSYHRLALELHPDKNGGDSQATEQFKLVQEAYEVLSDGPLRREYDQKRQALKPKQQPTASKKKRKSQPSAPAATSAPFPFNFPSTTQPTRPPPPPQTHSYTLPPQRTAPIHAQPDFTRFRFHDYFTVSTTTSKIRTTKFIYNLRVKRDESRASLRETRLEINIRTMDLAQQPQNPLFQNRLAELRDREKWWEAEVKNLEDLHERHVIRARFLRKWYVDELELKKGREERVRVPPTPSDDQAEVVDLPDGGYEYPGTAAFRGYGVRDEVVNKDQDRKNVSSAYGAYRPRDELLDRERDREDVKATVKGGFVDVVEIDD
jgi:curved DNA-binding protein CbpA